MPSKTPKNSAIDKTYYMQLIQNIRNQTDQNCKQHEEKDLKLPLKILAVEN